MTTIKVKDTEVLGVKSPTLEELKTRPCSFEELQAALVQLIEVVNHNEKAQSEFNERILRKDRAYGI